VEVKFLSLSGHTFLPLKKQKKAKYSYSKINEVDIGTEELTSWAKTHA
jgi:hypothetical protein